MTPKAKAKKLFFKFKNIDSDSELYDNFKMKDFYAQRCLLILVDEITSIKSLWCQKDTKELDYWKEFKQEIEKL